MRRKVVYYTYVFVTSTIVENKPFLKLSVLLRHAYGESWQSCTNDGILIYCFLVTLAALLTNIRNCGNFCKTFTVVPQNLTIHIKIYQKIFYLYCDSLTLKSCFAPINFEPIRRRG